ncbi:MAG: hypothetical protein Kow0069_25460 [Promethearchaeota archaeon]
MEVAPGATFDHPVPSERNAFAYILRGSARFDETREETCDAETVVLFGQGDRVLVRAWDDGVRFLFVSGVPIGEPVAWYGPIVMNTREELVEAFREYREGTFLKHEASAPA